MKKNNYKQHNITLFVDFKGFSSDNKVYTKTATREGEKLSDKV